MRRKIRLLIAIFGGLLGLCLIAGVISALSNRSLLAEYSLAEAPPASPERLADLDKARLAEALQLKQALGDQVWPGWGRADIPIILWTAGAEFLTGLDEIPAASGGTTWQTVGDDDFQPALRPGRLRAPPGMGGGAGEIRRGGHLAASSAGDRLSALACPGQRPAFQGLPPRTWRTSPQVARRACGSSPVVSSSRKTTSGQLTSASLTAAGLPDGPMQVAKLVASDGAPYSSLGNWVAIDGDTAIAGAPYADVDGKTDQGAAYVFHGLQANRPPLAEANGPYSVPEGGSITLDGSGSSDPDPGDTLTYAWDLDNDGVFETAGATADFAGIDGPASQPVTLQVCDSQAACATMLNRAPDCTAAAPSPALLWPPNNKFVPVTIGGVTDAEGDPLTLAITGIRQDEPVGTGNSAPAARTSARRSPSSGPRSWAAGMVASTM